MINWTNRPRRPSPARWLPPPIAPPLLGLAAALSACTHTVKVEPIKVEPIDITLHIYLEADRKLDSFFGDTPQPPAPTTPAPAGGQTNGKEGAPS